MEFLIEFFNHPMIVIKVMFFIMAVMPSFYKRDDDSQDGCIALILLFILFFLL